MRKDGTVIDVSVSVSQVRDDSGAIVGAATIARDVTERKWDEAERRAAEDSARRFGRMQMAAQLAGGIAQEFGGLLSTIMGYAVWVADAVPGNPELRGDVRQIQAAAGRAARLARKL